MPYDPRLTIPVLLGTIRAGRRSSRVARLLPCELGGRDEVATAQDDPAGPRPPRRAVSSGGFGGLNCLAQLQLVCRARGRVPIPVTLPVLRTDEAFDEPGTLRRPKLAARVRPSMGELN